MTDMTTGRSWWLAGVMVLGLLFGGPGTSLAVTPVDGHGLAFPVQDHGQALPVTAPGLLSGVGDGRNWSEGCLRDPAGAERLRQLHLNAVRPLALALDASLEAYLVPEWAACR